MRYSAAITAAFAVGALAKPHGRRSKNCSSALSQGLPVASDAVTAPSGPYSTQPASEAAPGTTLIVPVPPPAAPSTAAPALPSLIPTGGNGTIPQPTGGFAVSSSVAIEEASSALPLSSGAAAVSSALDVSITSSALPAESTAPSSDIPVGQVIYSCTVPGTFALTYDDGPFTYTNHILDLLAQTDIKVTFFVNGNNFGNINDFQDVINRAIADGHQIGSHTYSHPDLATLGGQAVIENMTELEDALDAIIGKIPTYMRPPYFSYNDQTLQVLGELGYHVIQADIDTLDYSFRNIGNLTGATNLQNGINNGGNLALAHDVHQNTAEVLTPEFIRIIQASGLRGVTVGECLGDPKENWYRPRRTTTPTAAAGPISTVSITSVSTPTGVVDENGACGGDSGFVCRAGSCCSQYGYCGSSEAYCAAGCQPEFGVCGVLVSADPAAAPAPTGGVSPDGSCGGTNGYTCASGNCCSQYGYCGSTTDHCGTGCQSAFGLCGADAVVAPTSSAAPAPSGAVSPDGSCGGDNGYTCASGNCCSQYGYCGSTADHCGTGCQSAFGTCGSAPEAPASSAVSEAPVATGGVSPDGSCGGDNGYTCITGACCSQYGYCGSTADHCGTGCQADFGICN